MSEFYERFGQRLRAIRKDANLTQDEVAVRLKVNRTTVVNIEKGRQRVALHQVVELADILGCEAAHLIPPAVDTEAPELGGVASEAAEFVSRVRSKRSRL